MSFQVQWVLNAQASVVGGVLFCRGGSPIPLQWHPLFWGPWNILHLKMLVVDSRRLSTENLFNVFNLFLMVKPF